MGIIKASYSNLEIDAASTLTRGLRGANTAVYLFGAEPLKSANAKNNLSVITGTQTVGQRGSQLSFNGSQHAVSPIVGIGTAEGTIMWSQRANDAYNSGTFRAAWGNVGGGSHEISAQVDTSNSWYVGWAGSGNDCRVVVAASTTNWRTDKPHTYAFTWVAGGASIFYMDGIELGRYTGSTVVASDGDYLTIGELGPSWGAWFNGDIDFFYVMDAALNSDEILSLSVEPNLIFTPESDDEIIIVNAASGAALAGNASDVATISGTLSGSSAPLAGAAVDVVAAAGNLTVQSGLAGAPTGVATASGALQSGSTFTTNEITLDSGYVYANVPGFTLLIIHPTLHTVLAVLTDLTPDATGKISVFVPGLPPGNYCYDPIEPGGERRLDVGTSV